MLSSSPASLPAPRRAKNATSKEGFRLKLQKVKNPGLVQSLVFGWMYVNDVCSYEWDRLSAESAGNPGHWFNHDRINDPKKFIQRFTAVVTETATNENWWPE